MLHALQNTSCCIYLLCGSVPHLIHLICCYRAFMCPTSNGPKLPDLVLSCLLLAHSLLPRLPAQKQVQTLWFHECPGLQALKLLAWLPCKCLHKLFHSVVVSLKLIAFSECPFRGFSHAWIAAEVVWAEQTSELNSSAWFSGAGQWDSLPPCSCRQNPSTTELHRALEWAPTIVSNKNFSYYTHIQSILLVFELHGREDVGILFVFHWLLADPRRDIPDFSFQDSRRAVWTALKHHVLVLLFLSDPLIFLHGAQLIWTRIG